jgi:hypothetical protein
MSETNSRSSLVLVPLLCHAQFPNLCKYRERELGRVELNKDHKSQDLPTRATRFNSSLIPFGVDVLGVISCVSVPHLPRLPTSRSPYPGFATLFFFRHHPSGCPLCRGHRVP